MQRDLARLTAHTFDVLVVGGGISGLTIACDAAQRGLSVALIEQNDFGSGSSFNHLRTIHGGLRYLQGLDIVRARMSMRERRALARIAPFALKVQPFVLPLTRSLTKGPLAMHVGFVLDAVVASGRNRDIPDALILPRGRVLSRGEAIERFPGLHREGLTGAAVWYDYATTEADRLTFAWALGAHAHGAVLANYVDAIEPMATAGRVEGVRARDRMTGITMEIGARLTINASGAGRGRLAPAGQTPPLLRAINLVTRREAKDEAIGARTKSGRHLFLVPWKGKALFGTWESTDVRASTDEEPGDREVDQFISELNVAFAALDLTRDDVMLVHRGLVPAVAAQGRVKLDGNDRVIDHGAGQPPAAGLMSTVATKYTTARALAEQAVDLAVAKLGRQATPCRTATTPLPGGELGDVAMAIDAAQRDYADRLPGRTVPHLVAAYGSRYREIADLAASRSEWRAPLEDNGPVVGAQIVHAVRHEMAVTLSDVVIRRTPLGALGYPGDLAVERAASIMSVECGWPNDRRLREIEAVRRFYQGVWNALKT